MKSPQVFTFLALFVLLVFSCKETVPDNKDPLEPQNKIPSADKPQLKKLTPRKPGTVLDSIYRDSLLKKQKKSKDLDTLRPKIALLE